MWINKKLAYIWNKIILRSQIWCMHLIFFLLVLDIIYEIYWIMMSLNNLSSNRLHANCKCIMAKKTCFFKSKFSMTIFTFHSLIKYNFIKSSLSLTCIMRFRCFLSQLFSYRLGMFLISNCGGKNTKCRSTEQVHIKYVNYYLFNFSFCYWTWRFL